MKNGNDVGSTQTYGAVVSTRDSGRHVSIAKTVDMYVCPLECNARELVKTAKTVRGSKLTPTLRLLEC